MRGTIPEVAMLTDISLISQQNVYGTALESWQFVVDCELRCQFINYYDIL